MGDIILLNWFEQSPLYHLHLKVPGTCSASWICQYKQEQAPIALDGLITNYYTKVSSHSKYIERNTYSIFCVHKAGFTFQNKLNSLLMSSFTGEQKRGLSILKAWQGTIRAWWITLKHVKWNTRKNSEVKWLYFPFGPHWSFCANVPFYFMGSKAFCLQLFEHILASWNLETLRVFSDKPLNEPRTLYKPVWCVATW